MATTLIPHLPARFAAPCTANPAANRQTELYALTGLVLFGVGFSEFSGYLIVLIVAAVLSIFFLAQLTSTPQICPAKAGA
jgi:hypothetical protein